MVFGSTRRRHEEDSDRIPCGQPRGREYRSRSTRLSAAYAQGDDQPVQGTTVSLLYHTRDHAMFIKLTPRTG